MARVWGIAVGSFVIACGGRPLADAGSTSTTTSTTSVADGGGTSPVTASTATAATTVVDTGTTGSEIDTSDDGAAECYSHSCLDLGWPAQHCNPADAQCPDGQKCVWYVDSSGLQRRDDAICIPVDGEVPPFHACTLPHGIGPDITDDCDANSYCLEVYGTADHGFCAPYMQPGYDCSAYPGTQPAVENGSEFPAACLVYECDPLAASPCPDDTMTCTYYPAFLYGALMCWHLPPTATLALGEPCDYGQCGDGLACVAAELVPGCADERCCTQWCDLDAPVCSDPAAICQAFPYRARAEGPFPRLGACTLPGVFD